MCEAERFYRERDRRTTDYLGSIVLASTNVSVHVSADACEAESGQLLLLTLANQLARIHREIHFGLATPDARLLIPAVCGGTNLVDELSQLVSRIDPYGKFCLDEAHQLRPRNLSVGIGRYCRSDLKWYLGCNRSIAELARTPCRLGQDSSSDLRGAGLAAVLGAAAVTKDALNIETAPRTVSAWNFQTGSAADAGPADLPSVDVGRSLMIGAGAVASAAIYWLMQWGNASQWTIIDEDDVMLHNTNRCLLFFPDDAGWPDSAPNPKVASLSRYLDDVVPVQAWYDQAEEARDQFDTVSILANERDVRTSVSHRNDPIQFQATTGRSWLSQLHRHIAGRDDCVRCRMADIRAPQLACSEAPLSTSHQPSESDSALPFLSAGSGLMLVTALQRLQLGNWGVDRTNVWSWDFRSALRMHSSGYYECRGDCPIVLPPKALEAIAANTRWLDAPWRRGGHNPQSHSDS